VESNVQKLENAIGKLDIAGVGLDLINENTGIDSNTTMTSKGRGQAD
jgi:hypothetical protein